MYFINNLPNGCNDTMYIYDVPISEDVIGFSVKPMNKMLIFESNRDEKTNCVGATGLAKLTDGADNLEIDYTAYISWDSFTKINKKFIGKRVK